MRVKPKGEEMKKKSGQAGVQTSTEVLEVAGGTRRASLVNRRALLTLS
jgi:hypothetical protein